MAYLQVKISDSHKKQKSNWFLKSVFTSFDSEILNKIINDFFCAIFHFLREMNENSFILTYIIKIVVFDTAKYRWLYLNISRVHVYVKFLLTFYSPCSVFSVFVFKSSIILGIEHFDPCKPWFCLVFNQLGISCHK